MRQAYPEHSDTMLNTYLDATERPHGYLLLDLLQDTDDRLTFRTFNLPFGNPHDICRYIDDETNKTKLSRYSRTQVGTSKTA